MLMFWLPRVLQFLVSFMCVLVFIVVATPHIRNATPGGGGTLKFSVYIGEADFFGVKILNFRIFWGFQKT